MATARRDLDLAHQRRSLRDRSPRLSRPRHGRPDHRIRGAAPCTGGSRTRLQRALTVFQRLGMPYEAACTQQLIAEALRRTEPELAVSEATAALSAFDELGAKMDGDACSALLR